MCNQVRKIILIRLSTGQKSLGNYIMFEPEKKNTSLCVRVYEWPKLRAQRRFNDWNTDRFILYLFPMPRKRKRLLMYVLWRNLIIFFNMTLLACMRRGPTSWSDTLGKSTSLIILFGRNCKKLNFSFFFHEWFESKIHKNLIIYLLTTSFIKFTVCMMVIRIQGIKWWWIKGHTI